MIECEPATSEEVAKVAMPPLSVPVPRVMAPSMKVAVPVGVPSPELTVAVRVTVLPVLVWLISALRFVELLVLITSLKGADVLPVKLLSPP